MAVLIDPPRWPAHGRLWSHLASDSSLDELHAFAGLTGIPRRAFEGDHYDIPVERYGQAVAAGAEEVEGRELLRRLVAAGLRVPKRRGEHILTSKRAVGDDLGAPQVIDLVASPHPAPDDGALGAWVLVTRARGTHTAARGTHAAASDAGATDAEGPDSGAATAQTKVLMVQGTEGWDLPGGPRRPGRPVVDTVLQALASAGVEVHGRGPEPVGYLRVRPLEPTSEGARAPWTYRALFRVHLDGVSAHGGPAQRAAAPATGATVWRSVEEAVGLLDATPLGPLVRHLVGVRLTGSAPAGEGAR